MVTSNDLKKVITTEEGQLLATDSGAFDPSLLDASIDVAYNHVLPYVRQVIPDAGRADVPDILDDKILSLAKWYLFARRGLSNEALDKEREYIEIFLIRVARGEIPIVASSAEENISGASGKSDPADLFGSKVFLL